MPDLPTIASATVEATAGGFVARALADTAEAHAAFDRSVTFFEYSQDEWSVYLPHFSEHGLRNVVFFIPALNWR